MNSDRDAVIIGAVLLLLWWLRPQPQIDTSLSFVDDNGKTWYFQPEWGEGNIWTDGLGQWLNSDTGHQWEWAVDNPGPTVTHA